MMSGIRSANTKPEMAIRKGLHARGFRYSLHRRGLPGKPDIVMLKWHVVIFVHGCFWHKHGCSLSKLPINNAAFWDAKLAGNRIRDEAVKQRLTDVGWRTATVWECATRGKLAIENLPYLLDRLAVWIRNPAESRTLEIASSDLLTLSPPASDNNKTK